MENENSASGATVAVWHIVVSLISGIVVCIFVFYIVRRSRRRSFKREPGAKSERTVDDSIYQDLDHTKMGTEDNYQSLTGNVARRNKVADDDYENAESPDDYQDLDVTNMNIADNYQSLTGDAGARINYATDNDDATYTQLSQFRGDENNYQSLT